MRGPQHLAHVFHMQDATILGSSPSATKRKEKKKPSKLYR
jgi:hypothetical protein